MDNRKPIQSLYLFFAFFALLTSFVVCAQEPDISDFIGDGTLPDWVDKIHIPDNYEVPQNTITNGTYYLLVNRQNKIEQDQSVRSFSRFATLIVNQKGIEHNSQIELKFDPSYQQIILNHLHVIRNGKIIDKLQDTEFSLLHNEQELGSQLYNGERTLHGIITDLRTGDILDYSYSVDGNNPVFSGSFARWRSIQWSIPVEKLSIRYQVPSAKTLNHTFINSDFVLQEIKKGEVTHYLYERNNVPVITADDDYPDWHAAYPHLLVTTRDNWQQVVDWGVDLFAQPMNASSENVDELVSEIRSNSADVEQQILRAIQFVQNEIRYFGIELGENSHRPSFAQDTLNRRYGDCKDKTVLLINILRKLDVEADPALVDSDGLALLPELVASEQWFDHVIVRLRYQGKDYWIDPTREMQFGPLDGLHQKNFGHGLILKPGETQLTKMDPPSYAELVTTDTWDLKAGKTANAQFTTENLFYGLDAEKQRNRIASDGVQKVSQSYLEHYQAYYEAIKEAGDIAVNDDREANIVSISQKYEVPEFWSEEEKEFNTTFYSDALNYLLNKPDDLDRSHPLAISYPDKITHNILINLYDIDWSFKTKSETVSNEFFTFQLDVFFHKEQNLLQLTYKMENHQDHVPVDQLDEYVEALSKARELTDYGIVEYKKDVDSANKSNETAASNSDANAEDSQGEELVSQVGSYTIAFGVLILFIALYAFIRHLNIKNNPYEGESWFYAVSKTKFFVLGFVTLGIYYCFWFYKNYQFEKEHNGRKVMPFWRALFYPLFYYPLYRTLMLRSGSSHLNAEPDVSEYMAPEETVVKDVTGEYVTGENITAEEIVVPVHIILFAVLIIGLSVLSYFYDKGTTLVLIATGILLLPVNSLIARKNINNDSLQYHSGWHWRHLLLGAIGAPFVAYILAFDIGVLPASKVIEGDSLYSHDINFMVDNNIIQQNEEIAWFYSDASLFIRDDGNGVTKKSVFSYFEDDNGELVIDTASFEQIDDIRVEWSQEDVGTTFVDIIKHDGEEFVLYVSNEDGLDKTFVQYLNNRLKPYK